MTSNFDLKKLLGLAALLIFVLSTMTVCWAQEERVAIVNPTPGYPALARQMHLSGVVRIRAVVTAAGELKQVEVIGGHPLLADAALNALKKWKYAPTKSETPIVLEFRFQP